MIQERGNPVLNQPGLNGITEGFWTLLMCQTAKPSIKKTARRGQPLSKSNICQASVIQKARRMQMQVPCQSRASEKRLFPEWLYSIYIYGININEW